MKRSWTKAEIGYLKRHAHKQAPEELGEHFGIDPEAVREKLVELGLPTEPSSGSEGAMLENYGEALQLLHGKKWQKAAELLTRIVEGAESPQLVDRACQNLAVCEQRLEEPEPLDDPYLQAVFEKNQGNLAAALDLCLDGGRTDKEERYAYLAASIQALAGSEEEALSHLATAIRLEPKNRVHAYHDPDFNELHGAEEFTALVATESS